MLSSDDDGKPTIATSFENIAQIFIRQGRLDSQPDYLPVIDPHYPILANE